MPHSMLVLKLMIPVKDWPLFSADMRVTDAIKLLRIITEEKKLEHGHSTPLVVDENYNLIGFVHLVDLLKSIRHLYEGTGAPSGPLEEPTAVVNDLVVTFAGSVTPDDPILKALKIMMDHRVSLVPVMKDHKLYGIVKLSDIFNTVASLLFDKEIVSEREVLIRRFRL
ncbi:MAG: CBS domain-containing protein [Deltaproteobacteria bacterium]|nr:CBS domain-containing protein [Deltaproteobacteria bacterium]